MDDALHAPLEIGFEGQHITVRGQRHELVLQVVQHIVLHGVILDLAHAALMQTAQLHAHLIELGGAFVLEQGIVGDAAVQSRRQLHGQGLGIRQRQQARPLPFRFGHGDGLPGGLRLTQHFPQRPEGFGIGLCACAAPFFHDAQQTAHIGEGGKAETAFGKGTLQPDSRLLIEAGGFGCCFGIRQGSKMPGAFASGGSAAQFGQPGRNFAEFQRMESAGVYHAADGERITWRGAPSRRRKEPCRPRGPCGRP